MYALCSTQRIPLTADNPSTSPSAPSKKDRREKKQSEKKARRNSRDANLEKRLCKNNCLRKRKAIGVLSRCELTGFVCATVGVTMLLDLEKSYKK